MDTDHHTGSIQTKEEVLRNKQLITKCPNVKVATLKLIQLFMQYESTF